MNLSVDSGASSTTTTDLKIPKNRWSFLAQIVVVYTIIITSLIHLSLQSPDKVLWLILLSSSVEYILPSRVLNSVNVQNYRNNERLLLTVL